MGELLATTQRSQTIRVPADQLWRLLSGPQAWAVLPDRFAFDVTVPPATRLRVVLGVGRSRPIAATYELNDEAQSLAMSLPAGTRSGAGEVISVSAVPDGDSTVATIAIRVRGRRAHPGSGRWLARWLAGLREVAEGHAPHPCPGMPESLRIRCTPAPLRKPVTASASALIAAPPAVVWDVVYAPASSMTTPEIAAAGVVPGTPEGRVGEMQYFVHKDPGGWFDTRVIAVTQVDPGRSARAAAIRSPGHEILHLVTPQDQGTRVELTHCWPGNIPGGKSKAHARAMADAAQHAVADYRDLIESRGTQQP